MKLTDLFEYNKEFGSLKNTATWIKANYDGTEWIIQYEITELSINGHVHNTDLNAGIKMIIDSVIESCIWETEENAL